MKSLIFRKNRILAIAMAFALAMFGTACSDDNDEPAPVPEPVEEPAADYTIMMYATGGGNLDAHLEYNLNSVKKYGYTPKVQFSAMVKYSEHVQAEAGEDYEGTRLLTLTKDGLSNEKAADNSFRMDNPQNLADYITETMKRLPAKKYILLLWDHGSSFSIDDQPVENSYPGATRAVLSDDSTGEMLSIFELEEALKRTGKKLDMIYWDVCLMNCIENIYQIGEYTHYVMGAAHTTPGVGGNYAQLMESLDHHADLPTAMKEYVPATVGLWENLSSDDSNAADLEMYDMSHLNEVMTAVKDYMDDFIAYKKTLTRGSKAELDLQYMNGSAKTDNYYKSDGGILYYFGSSDGYVDLQSAFTRFGSGLLNGALATDANKVKLAFDKFIVAGASIRIPAYMSRVSVSLNWMPAHLFTAKKAGKQISGFDELYATLKFDQFTGWSNFLKENEWRVVELDFDGYVEIKTLKWQGKMEVLNMDDYSADAYLQKILNSLTAESNILFLDPEEVRYQLYSYIAGVFETLVLSIMETPEIPIQFKISFISVDGEEEDVFETFIYPVAE